VEEIETLVREIEQLADAGAREKARAVVAATIAMHRAGIEELLAALRGHGGDAAVRAAAGSDAVRGVLLLHGLHPDDAMTRARAALEGAASTLRALGASAQVAAGEGGGLRVRIEERGGRGKGALAVVEEALTAAVPDVTYAIERREDATGTALVPVERLRASGALAASQRARDADEERCDLCGAALGARHDHVVAPATREVRCACGACATLFASGAGQRWRRVPHRAERLPDLRLRDDAWDALGLPIDLVFFHRSTNAGRIVAMYPGPAGATESLLPLDAWTRVERDNPSLASLAPDVEALLVRRARGEREGYRVSIDVCYALAGDIRKHWRGLGGGTDAWARIDAFFDGLNGAGGTAHA
jgi:hypothetical protein